MPECTGPIQLPSVHAHDLARSHRTHEWRCDGCTSPGQANRYRCLREGCDFDLCQSCWDAACLFTWRDLRVGLKPELGGGSMTYGVGGMQVVSNTGPNTLPENWRHDAWLPSGMRRVNEAGTAFPYIHFDGTFMLRSLAPCRVRTVVLVVRLRQPSSHCLLDICSSRIDQSPRERETTDARPTPAETPSSTTPSAATPAPATTNTAPQASASASSGGSFRGQLRASSLSESPPNSPRLRRRPGQGPMQPAHDVPMATPAAANSLFTLASFSSSQHAAAASASANSASSSSSAHPPQPDGVPLTRGSAGPRARVVAIPRQRQEAPSQSSQPQQPAATAPDQPSASSSRPQQQESQLQQREGERESSSSSSRRRGEASGGAGAGAAGSSSGSTASIGTTTRNGPTAQSNERPEPIRAWEAENGNANANANAGNTNANAGNANANPAVTVRESVAESAPAPGGGGTPAPSASGSSSRGAREGSPATIHREGPARPPEPHAPEVGGAWVLAGNNGGTALGGSWNRMGRLGQEGGALEQVSVGGDLSARVDEKWQVVVVQRDASVEGHIHLMGSRRGANKCAGDVAEVLVFDKPLAPDQILRVASDLAQRCRIQPPRPKREPLGKVSKEMLVKRMRELQAAYPLGPRLDIPKWLDRYVRCFQVVDSLTANAPLPSWFTAEIEPRSNSEPCSPSVAASPAAAGGSGHVPPAARPIEALFDPSRCGSSATLDPARTRVEFSGMASALLTMPVPPEGVHVMEFDVHGRDQCLVGIATPDVDVETYLGHKRGGYGFFAAEGTLKVDGDWKGGHGLCKYKKGERVGVHVDMTRRTLQFSISRWVVEAQGAQGKWVQTMLDRTVEGLPATVHFAVGGAQGGELSIAGGSTSASVGEERISSVDVNVDGGYDNGNWPAELDAQLVEFLNEKATERRKHPRHIRSASLVGAGFLLSDQDPAQLQLAGTNNLAAPTPGAASGSPSSASSLPASEEAGARDPEEDKADESNEAGSRDPESNTDRIEVPHLFVGPPSPSGGSVRRDSEAFGEVGAYVRYQRRRADSLGGNRSAAAVRARFVVLKKLESLVAATLPLVDLTVAHDPCSAAGRLASIKGRLFEATKTHLWDAAIRISQDRKEEIPSVTLFRGAAAQYRRRSGRKESKNTVFGQLFAVLEDAALLRSKSKGKGMMAWQVNFAGEGGDDYGGLFRESIRELAADLQSSATSLFVPVPNSRHNVGFNRDTFLPNPACQSAMHLRQFRFIGKLMGCGMRTSNPLGLDLPPLFWRRFLGEECSVRDLATVDERFVRAVEALRTHPSAESWPELRLSAVAAAAGAVQAGEEAGATGLVWTVRSLCGRVVEVVKGGASKPLRFHERRRYAELAVQLRLTEMDRQLEAMREGMAANVPILMLPLMTWKELMVRVCGEVTVDLEVLRGIVKNKLEGGDGDPMMSWLWATLEEFTNEERKQFLGFVWGRERLPRDTSGLQLEVRTQTSHGDSHLPSSHTCFNAVDIPCYSSQQVLRDKLRYAIVHCKAIDTDFAARGPLAEDAEEEEDEFLAEAEANDVEDSDGGSEREALAAGGGDSDPERQCRIS